MANYSTSFNFFGGISQRVRDRFYENLSDYPRCTDYLEAGHRKYPKEIAIQRRYIEFNRENYWCKYLPFDLDYGGAGLAWYDLNLPCPTICVITKQNGHAHLTYELEFPVHLGGNASKKAIYYLDVIRKGYIKELDADPTYGGLLSKNPLSDFWFVRACDVTYELDFLAEPVREDIRPEDLQGVPLSERDDKIKEALIPVDGKRKPQPAVNLDADGSLFVFNNARFYAYEIVPDCKRYSELYDKIEGYIVQLGVEHEERLTAGRIRSETKSVSKWVWDRRADFVAKRAAFCEIQRQRAYRSHKARKRNNTTKIQAARNKLRKTGETITKTAIAEASGISTRALSERKLKTDLSAVRSANAHQTNEIRKAATEEKIKKAFEQALREGINPTQKNIAKLAGVGIATVKRYWKQFKVSCEKGIIRN